MYRLKVKVTKKSWKFSFTIFDTYLDAQVRQEELRLKGIKSIITDSCGKIIK